MNVDHLSFSSLSKWLQCPRSWWAKYVEKRDVAPSDAASFGSAFDQAISAKLGLIKPEEITKTVEGVESSVNFYMAQPWAWTKADSTQEQIAITPEQWETMAESIEAESEIHAPITGYIDLFRVEGIERQVVDIKTSSRAGWRTDWGLQGMLYCLAKDAHRFEIHLLATGKKVPSAHRYVFKPTVERLRWMMETLGCIAKQIKQAQKGDVLLRNADYWCAWCPEKVDCVASISSTVPEMNG